MNGIWRFGGSSSTDNILTPTNIKAVQQTTVGCANIMPTTIGNATLFVQAAGKKIGEFVYNWETDGYRVPDLTRLANYLPKDGLVDVAYQQEPLSIVWGITTVGKLLGLTYLRDEDVVGWHTHDLGGVVESCAVIPGDGYDELWVVVKRTINGQTVRYVEVMANLFEDTNAEFQANKGLNAFFVNAGLTYNGASATEISGLAHLEGETVTLLADGSIQASKVVTNGKITLDQAATIVHIGLSYTGTVQLQRLEVQLQDGTAQGRPKRTPSLIARVYCSGTFKAGYDEANLDVVSFRTSDMAMGSPPDLFTGDKQIMCENRFGRENRLMIVQDKPLPLTLIAIMPETEIV